MESVEVESAETFPVIALSGQSKREKARAMHAAGMSNSEIAGMLSVNKSTVSKWSKNSEVASHA